MIAEPAHIYLVAADAQLLQLVTFEAVKEPTDTTTVAQPRSFPHDAFIDLAYSFSPLTLPLSHKENDRLHLFEPLVHLRGPDYMHLPSAVKAVLSAND